MPLTVAHGFQSLRGGRARAQDRCEDRSAAGCPQPHAPGGESESRSAGSMVTLAAVDNGVLQVSNFKTPDPYGHFYANRALEVNAYDLYPLLFPELRARLSSTGGDGDMDMNKRTNPMPAKA